MDRLTRQLWCLHFTRSLVVFIAMMIAGPFDSGVIPEAFAASTTPEIEIMPKQIFAHNVCGDAPFGVRLLADQAALEQVIKGGRVVLGAASSLSVQVDWEHNHVLHVSMGSQRTGGYALRYQPKALEIDQGVASLTVEWLKPRAGQMVIQMLTQPCLVLVVPKGPYKTLRVQDQTGRLLGEVPVN